MDVCFEAVGAEQTFQQCIAATRIGGRVAFIGIPETDVITLDPHLMRRKELVVYNVRRSNNTLKKCINLVASGAIKLDGLATHHFPLASINTAFDMLRNYSDDVIKAIITPSFS